MSVSSSMRYHCYMYMYMHMHMTCPHTAGLLFVVWWV